MVMECYLCHEKLDNNAVYSEVFSDYAHIECLEIVLEE